MCIVKTPKVQATTQKVPEPIVIRNQFLDGIDPVSKALRMGRSSLRIERAGSRPTGLPANASPTSPSGNIGLPPIAPILPTITPVPGGGGGATLMPSNGGSGGGRGTSDYSLYRTVNYR